MRVREERGTIMLLTIGYASLALVVILIAVAATSLYLERKRLFTLADGAALVGAEAFELSQVRRTQDGLEHELDSADVHAAVVGYLAVAPTARFEALSLDAAFTPDGKSATVRLSSFWRPPVVTLFVPDGIRLEVTATARSVFG